jgi:hypothetical protein
MKLEAAENSSAATEAPMPAPQLPSPHRRFFISGLLFRPPDLRRVAKTHGALEATLAALLVCCSERRRNNAHNALLERYDAVT